jgi:NADPH-dependent glutamate synthase beta subunit-like oxidoreductase
MPDFRMEITEAVEEGVKIVDSRGPKRIIRNDGGKLTVEMSRCIRVFDEEGRFCTELENTCELSPCADSIVVAFGQRADDAKRAAVAAREEAWPFGQVYIGD